MKLQVKPMERRRKTLMRKLAKTGPFIEGSLAVTPQKCASKNCVCHHGKPHQAMFLTWKEDGKTRSMYIPVDRRKEALEMNRNYRKLKKLVRSLSGHNKKALVIKKKP